MWDKNEPFDSSHKASNVNDVDRGGRPEGSGLNRKNRITVYLTEDEKAAVTAHFTGHNLSAGVFCRDLCMAMSHNADFSAKVLGLIYPHKR
ncbi:MAG: hypothetical protein ACRDCT_02460 [Shewanella sp.]|uniref:hypothetical protein n=1 Tax=Shewanella sp. TaxID=50422 RepID=UPI003F38C6E5